MHPATQPSPERFVLRNLPLAARLALAAFLVSVGIGYFSALVQLHFQHARPGNLLPDGDDATDIYHGQRQTSQLERLLVASEHRPFNGGGAMSQAFTTRSAGWQSAINRRARLKGIPPAKAEAELRAERNGERLAMLHWLRTGAGRKEFEDNSHTLPAAWGGRPITAEFTDPSADGTVRVKIAALFEARCTRCHAEGGGGTAGQVPLENWEQINEYCQKEPVGGGMSLKKLAQSTHVHLLGFSLLYGLTGLLIALTSYPAWVRVPLAVLPLAAQLVDIGCWWAGRFDPLFARAVVVTGSVVAGGLFLQVVLSLFHLFGRAGKAALVLLLVGACLGGYFVKEYVIDPYLEQERTGATAAE
jgi:hypothetical protein